MQKTTINKALIIFLKYPEKGKVKTRIAASMGDEFTHGLYYAFVTDILDMSQNINADKIIALDRADDEKIDSFDFSTGYPVILQKGEDIGSKMFFALWNAFVSGYESVVLIGSDSPDLPAETIEKAFASLDVSDAVLGPSTDGGYYLIGFNNNAFDEKYFKDIEWSTDSVFQKTVDKINASEKTVSCLPEWRDIDDFNDLKYFYDEKTSMGKTSSHTMKYIIDYINNNQIHLL